jgi:hypothetical protein
MGRGSMLDIGDDVQPPVALDLRREPFEVAGTYRYWRHRQSRPDLFHCEIEWKHRRGCEMCLIR